MPLRIANAAGFLGDNLDAPRLLVEAEEVDYLTLEYLAELTLAILARARQKDSTAGFARDFLDVLKSLGSALYLQPQLTIVTNAGGMNPVSCAREVGRILSEVGSPDLPIGVVTGDDVLPRLEELITDGCTLDNMDTGQSFSDLKHPVESANVYLGAAPIVDALAQGARVVITGRVADASLAVGPAVYEFGWNWEAWDQLAAASVAGHLIECGAQATGGYSQQWPTLDLHDVGYPIAEFDEDSSLTITKPQGTGGAVTRATVVEQLVYEIGDPRHYLTPDVDVDFTTVEVADQGDDRVRVRGATGHPAPPHYKATLTYSGGYTASAQLVVFGRDCVAKSQAVAEMVWARLKRAGCELNRTHAELLGAGQSVPGFAKPPGELREVVLRLAVQDRRREAVVRFTKEMAPLITSGPAGLAGYASGRSPVRQVLANWPARIPKELVPWTVQVDKARDWGARL